MGGEGFVRHRGDGRKAVQSGGRKDPLHRKADGVRTWRRDRFDRVVLLRKDNEVLVGKPYVEGARVVGKVLEHAKARKVKTVKYRPRKNSKVEKGHRQWYTAIKIEKIEV